VAERGRDREFRFPQISYIDYKQIEIDRTLLNLFPRLKFDGYLGRIKKLPFQLTIEAFLSEFTDEKYKDVFVGFAEHQDVVYKWLETDLLDLVNRGHPIKQSVVSPRPLHGNTYKFRNAHHARDYGTAEQVYWMLYHAQKGPMVLSDLKRFLFLGLDAYTDKIQLTTKIDVETQAILFLDGQVKEDFIDTSKNLERYPPLCIHRANIFAEDILCLLAYENYIPRSVLVDYLKILFAFHLALYHLHLFKLLPELIKRQRSSGLTCQVKGCALNPAKTASQADCACHTGLVVEMGDPDNAHMIELARRSADTHYRRIPSFIQAQFTIKNLDDMVNALVKMHKVSRPAKDYFSVIELLQFLEREHDQERNNFFEKRRLELIEKNEQNGELSPALKQVNEIVSDDFEAYIEMKMAERGSFYLQYITECIDSLLLKNRESGLLHRSRTRETQRQRRFTMGSRLLEVLLQIAVLRPQGTSFVTQEMRVDDLLAFLRNRYGLYIDCLPASDGFGRPSITDLQALSRNKEAFKMRLREIGFFQDLSDAYVTQTITPRYTITADGKMAKKPLGGKR
jgi:hypothetical protein